jgi:hypothetical protein
MICGIEVTMLINLLAHNTPLLLALWVAFEQWVGSTNKVKANSTTELLLNMMGITLKHAAKKSGRRQSSRASEEPEPELDSTYTDTTTEI